MDDRKVHFTVSFTVTGGRAADFKKIAEQMVEVSRKEQGTLAYDWYFSADGNHCRLLESYASAQAAGVHMKGAAVRDFVPKLLETCTPTCFEVYGDPGAEAGEVLAKFGANIFNPWLRLK